MDSRSNPRDAIFNVVYSNIAPQRVHEVDRIFRFKLVRPASIGIGPMVECPNRTDISQIATELRNKHFFYISVYFCLPPAARGAQLVESSNIFIEADAAGAVDASSHVGDY